MAIYRKQKVITETITIPAKKMEKINDMLHLTGKEICEKYGYRRDDTIIHRAKFPDGIEADVKLVVCGEDDLPYTEAVLFDNGFDVAYSEPEWDYDGEWHFEYKGKEYVVNVVAEDGYSEEKKSL